MTHKSKYLFAPKDINTLIEEAEDKKLMGQLLASDDEPNGYQYKGPAAKFIDDLQNALVQAKHIDFVTSGNLALHNIIEIILLQFGKCDAMYISTWAIKESAARAILSLHERDLIGDLYGVFDYRIKSLDAKSFQLIEPLFKKYELTKNHAKVILLSFEYVKVTILTSANMSNNPRIEAGYISLARNPYYFHVNWMTDVLSGIKAY